jgi:hypothetical protein
VYNYKERREGEILSESVEKGGSFPATKEMERISRCKETFIPMWPMYFVFSRVVEYNL